MKKLSQSNIYGAGAVGIAELFSDYVEGGISAENCIALTLSTRAIGPAARDAIEKSLAALGYGRNANACATLMPREPDAEGGDIMLDPQALFMLVEGLDPIAVIAADEASVHALGQAYRCAFETDAPLRAFGRPAVAFGDLAALLETDAGKQKAWRLFKTLPKRA